MKKMSEIKFKKLKLPDWKFVGLWLLVLAVILVCLKNINSKPVYVSINYAPYGTAQNQAKLEYGRGFLKYVVRESVKDFKVTFKVNAKRLDDVVIRIGDQSGTVQIESVEIQSDGQYLLLSGEEVLDYFAFDQIDQCTIKDEWVEIFTYNVEKSEMTASDGLNNVLQKGQTKYNWLIPMFAAVFLGLLLLSVQKRKEKSIVRKVYQRLAVWLKTFDKKIFIIVSALSILGCIIFSVHVSDFIFHYMIKYHNVIISNSYLREDSSENTVKVFDNNYEEINSLICVGNIIEEKRYGFYDFAEIKDAVVDSRNIAVVEAEKSDYGYGYLELLDEDSYLVLSLPVYPNTCLTLSTDNNKYATSVSDMICDYRRVVAYENAADASIIKVYPYKMTDYIYVFGCYLLVYFILFIILFFMMLAACRFLDYFLCKNTFTQEYNPLKIFIIITLTYVTFSSIVYYINLRGWQPPPIADVHYYMNPQILDESGHFSLEATADYLVGFRGYFSIIIAVAAKGLELLTGIEMIYFYILYHGILVAFTIGIAMPKLYEYFTDKRASNAMCLMMFLLFSLFWYPFFFYALADLPAAMCAISAIAYILSGLKKLSLKDMLLGGILFGIALSYRMAYKYVLAALCLWMAAEIIMKLFVKEINWKKVILILGGLSAGLIIVAFPQFILNYLKGHIGFFPYSEGRGYDVNSNGEFSVTWGSFTRGFHMYNLGLEANVDSQLARIDQFYYMSKLYSPGDLIYMVLANPLEFCVGYFKHLFWAMSAGVEAAYHEELAPECLRTIASLLNYALIAEYILIFIDNSKNKLLKLKDEILIFLLTFFSIGIQNLSHIERRYYLFYYMFIYFIMSFVFQDYIRQKWEQTGKINLKHFIILGCFIAGCYIFNQTIRYNFMG